MPKVFGSLYPVCCAVELSAEVLNEFIFSNETFIASLGPGHADPNLLLIDSFEEPTYLTRSVSPITKPSSPVSPFIGKTALECYLLLRHLCRERGANADIECTSFAVMDRRTVVDGTVLLVDADGEEPNAMVMATARCAGECVNFAWFVEASGKFGVDDFAEQAEEMEDGVWRY